MTQPNVATAIRICRPKARSDPDETDAAGKPRPPYSNRTAPRKMPIKTPIHRRASPALRPSIRAGPSWAGPGTDRGPPAVHDSS